MSLEREARVRASAFREEHGLDHAPLGDLVALIDLTQQVDVAILDSGPDEHGMTMRDPDRGVVMVAAARTRNPMRQRSTLAHELGHILFKDYATPRTEGWGKRDPEEIRADAFARHLLIPIEGLVSSHMIERRRNQKISPQTLSALVQRYVVSPALVAIQLAEADLISDDHKRELSAFTTPSLAAQYGWSDQYKALQQESDTRRAPQRLLTRAVAGYMSGTVSLPYIARLRGIPVEEVQAEFEAEGIVAYAHDELTDEDAALLTPPPRGAGDAVDLSDLDALGDEPPA